MVYSNHLKQLCKVLHKTMAPRLDAQNVRVLTDQRFGDIIT